jgi:hypothetical protein
MVDLENQLTVMTMLIWFTKPSTAPLLNLVSAERAKARQLYIFLKENEKWKSLKT